MMKQLFISSVLSLKLLWDMNKRVGIDIGGGAGGAGGSLATQTKSWGDRALSRFGPEKHF